MPKNIKYIKIFSGSVIILIILYIINCYILEKSLVLSFDEDTGAINTKDGSAGPPGPQGTTIDHDEILNKGIKYKHKGN